MNHGMLAKEESDCSWEAFRVRQTAAQILLPGVPSLAVYFHKFLSALNSKRFSLFFLHVFNSLAGVMLRKCFLYLFLSMAVTSYQRPVWIFHHMPARACNHAINKLAAGSIDDQQIVYFSTYNATMLFCYV